MGITMKNITLAIDDDVLDRARAYADKHGTTVNALVREHLSSLIGQDERREAARQRLRELMATSEAQVGPDFKWNREEIYEERMFPRHKRPDLRGRRKKG
jgi:Family of unknown function (DUF6364)